jgi:predicted alpha/beta hydrolase family esterase
MKRLLFIHGAGEGAYKADQLLADSLQQELGAEYKVRYPKMPDGENAPYEQWKREIQTEISARPEPVILVGHSVGASHLAKILTEIEVADRVTAIFLLEAPFWGGDGWHYEGHEELEVPKESATKFPKEIPLFLYHTRDDETVPFDHLALYARLLPHATVREIDKGGHQLNNDLSIVANEIKKL